MTPLHKFRPSLSEMKFHPTGPLFLKIQGLSGKFADTANKTRNVYPRLKKFCINKYQLSSINYTEYDSLFLIIDRFIRHNTE